MRTIAILTTSIRTIGRTYNDYEDYYSPVEIIIADSMTDWEEVSEEDFQILRGASHNGAFTILEKPTNLPQFIKTTVAAHKKKIADEQERIEKEKKQRADEALAKKIKKSAKTIEAKKALLEKLKEELGES